MIGLRTCWIVVTAKLTFQLSGASKTLSVCASHKVHSCCSFKYLRRVTSPLAHRTLSSRLLVQRLPYMASLESNCSSRDRLSIFDLTVEEVAEDYGLPLDYVVDVLISSGANEPIHPNDVLASRVKESKKNEVLEALSFSDAVEIGELYLQPSVAEVAEANGVKSSQVLAFLRKEGYEAPLGSRTRIPSQYIPYVEEHIRTYLSRFRSE